MSVPSTGCVLSGHLSLRPRLLGNPASRLMGGGIAASLGFGVLGFFFLLSASGLLCFSRETESLLPSQPRGAGLLSARTVIGVHGQESGVAAF